MNEIQLKYGCNPNQKPSRVFMKDGSSLPFEVLNGTPGYINLLDAFNSWQLVKEAKEATGHVAAASFKHVSPAGAAIDVPLDDTMKKVYFVDDGIELTPVATAYIRARGADRMSSFGDFAALSDECDVATAKYLSTLVSDGIIAPSYSDEALEILKQKKRGSYCIIKMDPDYEAAPLETKDVFGITFEQGHNNVKTTRELFSNIVTEKKELTEDALNDMILANIILKYTQSNSVCYVKDGQAIGIGAGQQSRIHCTRLAGDKADKWFLRQSPKALSLPFKSDVRRPDRDNTIDVYLSDDYMDVLADGRWENFFTEKPEPMTREERAEWIKNLDNVTLGSDAFIPFSDNIERAHRSGVKYVAEAGGSKNDQSVIDACNEFGMVMAFTGLRLFHH